MVGTADFSAASGGGMYVENILGAHARAVCRVCMQCARQNDWLVTVKGYTMPYIILYIIYPFIGCGAWRTHRTGRGGVHTACDPLPRNTVSCAWMGQPAPTVSNSTPVMLPRPTLHKYNWNRVVQVECLRYSVHTIQQIHRQLPAYLR